jgi:hypothetical protein
MATSDLADGFDEKPTLGEAPATCQLRGCDTPPARAVKFREPTEYLCYCDEHAIEKVDTPGAKYYSRLRP